MTRTYDHMGPAINPAMRARFLGYVQAHPGATADELEKHLKVHDRLMLRPVLRVLVSRMLVRRDEGRYWPT